MDDSKRCTAKLSDGTRRCKKTAMRGQRVCRSHGGASPQAMSTARERLEAAADPAAAKLADMLDGDDARVAVRAAIAILDRAGYSKMSRNELVRVSREQAHVLCTIIDRVLSHFGFPPGHRAVVDVVYAELIRVEGLRDAEREKRAESVPQLSPETKQRIAAELDREHQHTGR